MRQSKRKTLLAAAAMSVAVGFSLVSSTSDAFGLSSGSGTSPTTVSSADEPEPGSLPAPTDLAVIGTTSSTVSLTWEAALGAGNYHIFADGIEVGVTTRAHVTVAGLHFNKRYVFTVAGGEGDSNSHGAMSDGVVATTASVTLTAPTNLRMTSNTSTALSVSAGGVTYADHYLWYVNGVAHGASDNPSYVIRGLKAGTSYTVAVAADTITTAPGPASVGVKMTTRQ